jgi:hypothetical protein
MKRWDFLGVALLLAVPAACDSNNSSGASNTAVASVSSGPPQALGPEGKYELDSDAYVKAMAASWRERFPGADVETMAGQLTATGWVELQKGGIANTNLTTTTGGKTGTISMQATWTIEGTAIQITPNTVGQGVPLGCPLTTNVLTCRSTEYGTPKGPEMVFIRK